MTLPDEEIIVIHGKPLREGSTARCAMCGKSRGLGRIMSPGFEYGMVLCDAHGEVWLDAVVNSFGGEDISFDRILRAAGLR